MDRDRLARLLCESIQRRVVDSRYVVAEPILGDFARVQLESDVAGAGMVDLLAVADDVLAALKEA